MDAMLGSRGQLLLKPQQLESTAAIQQPLVAPAARSMGQPGQPGQPGMEDPGTSAPVPPFASLPPSAPGMGMFPGAQMPMHPAAVNSMANPMTLHLYQALMAASMMGAPPQIPLPDSMFQTCCMCSQRHLLLATLPCLMPLWAA